MSIVEYVQNSMFSCLNLMPCILHTSEENGPQVRTNKPSSVKGISDIESIPVMTVGDRMLQRVLRNGVMDSIVSSQGYISQEEEESVSEGDLDNAPELLPATKKNIPLRQSDELHSTQSEHRKCELDSGWIHHVAMRTCATEVQIENALSIILILGTS